MRDQCMTVTVLLWQSLNLDGCSSLAEFVIECFASLTAQIWFAIVEVYLIKAVAVGLLTQLQTSGTLRLLWCSCHRSRRHAADAVCYRELARCHQLVL